MRKFLRIVEAWIALLCACARFQAADPAAAGIGIAPSRWWLLSGRIPRAPRCIEAPAASPRWCRDYLVMTRPTSTMNIPAKRIPVIGTNIAGSQAAA